MIMMIVILIGCFFLMAFFARIPGNPHKNVILENTLPKDKLTDPQVMTIGKNFKRDNLLIAIIFSLLAVPLFWLSYDSLMMLAFFILLFGQIAATYLCQIHYIKKLRELILKNQWELPVTPITIDTKLVVEKNRKMIHKNWIIASSLLTLAGSGYSFFQLGSFSVNWIMLGCCLLMLGTFLGGYYYIARFPVKNLTDNEAINRQSNDLMKYYWSLMITVMGYLFIPLPLIPVIAINASALVSSIFMTGFFVVITVGCIFCLVLLFQLRKKQDSLIEQITHYRYHGEDQYWKYGVYINPDDSRLMVPDRIGLNLSINLGKRSGQWIMGLLGLFILCITIVVVFPLFIFDFGQQQFQFDVTDNQVVLSAPFTTTTTIPIKEIKQVERVDQIATDYFNELPGSQIRVNGMATKNYLTGDFKIDDRQAVLYIDKQAQPVIKISTNNRDYYFAEKDSQETEELYSLLQASLAE